MPMTVSTTKLSAKQFLRMGEDPPGVRLELVNGEVAVSPSPVPNHSFVVVRLGRIVDAYVTEHGLGEVYQDVDTLLDQLNVRRPDLLYFSRERLHLIGKKAMEGPPDLAVEVISPSSVEIDRDDKFAQYCDAGIAHYWIADPMLRTLEGWSLKAGTYEPTGRGQGNAIIRLPPFSDLDIPLAQLWRPGS